MSLVLLVGTSYSKWLWEVPGKSRGVMRDFTFVQFRVDPITLISIVCFRDKKEKKRCHIMLCARGDRQEHRSG